MHAVTKPSLTLVHGINASAVSASFTQSPEINSTLQSSFLLLMKQRASGHDIKEAPVPLIQDLFKLHHELAPSAALAVDKLLQSCTMTTKGVVAGSNAEIGGILCQLNTPDNKYLLYGMDSSSTEIGQDTSIASLCQIQSHSECFESPTAEVNIFVRDKSASKTLSVVRIALFSADAFDESKHHARSFAAVTQRASAYESDNCFRNLSLGSAIFSIVAQEVKSQIAERNETRRSESYGKPFESASVLGYFLFAPQSNDGIYTLGVRLLVEKIIPSFNKPDPGVSSIMPSHARFTHESHTVGVHRTSAGLLETEHFEAREVMRA